MHLLNVLNVQINRVIKVYINNIYLIDLLHELIYNQQVILKINPNHHQ